MLPIEEGDHTPLSVELEGAELGKSCESRIGARADIICSLGKARGLESARSLEKSAGVSDGGEAVRLLVM